MCVQVSQSKADTMIDVDNCLMSCAFHPEHPALIAGGTFNGDLYVWDLSGESDLQKSKSDTLSEVRHREPICSILWQYSISEYNKYGNKAAAYRIVTLGADGKVLVWVWHKSDTTEGGARVINPVYGYQLLWPCPGIDRKIVWGGTCMSFLKDPSRGGGGPAAQREGSTFMVGTEGGKLFKCYFDLNDAGVKEFVRAQAAGEKAELRCPIRDTSFDAHAGSVYGLDCSPFQRDLFLSTGADGTVRLYHALKQQHLLVMEPTNSQVYGVQWSPFRPMVFAAAAGDGRVYFYDLLRVRDIIRPVLCLDANMQVHGAARWVGRQYLNSTTFCSVCLFAVVGGMLCKSDKPSIIIIIN